MFGHKKGKNKIRQNKIRMKRTLPTITKAERVL